ncbi:MAG: aminotransferase class IV, partial [Bacteroidia bacterium]|nr:aminotransferase class IV [Bacteroidia bacterium]
MRRWIIENAPKLGYVVNETELTIEQLKQADECFLTNAINGIISVNNLVDKKFKNKVSINFQRLFENEG